jgi:Zn-finger nucleic acid-binding protein
MKCPKCGLSMEEVDLDGIVMEQCTSAGCGGVYMDKGEMDLFLKLHESHGFLGRLLKRIK